MGTFWSPEARGWIASNGWIYPRALRCAVDYRELLGRVGRAAPSASYRAFAEQGLREISTGWREIIESREKRR